MSDINSVKAQIQTLIDLANATTGNSDTNLTDGVNALVSGYGQGGSGGSNNLGSISYINTTIKKQNVSCNVTIKDVSLSI